VVIRDSKLGFRLSNSETFGKRFSVTQVHERNMNTRWETVWGEEKYIVNRYNEVIFRLDDMENSKNVLVVKFRVFDDGIGFRYEILKCGKFKKITIEEELTEFNVDQNSLAWWIAAYQVDRYEYPYKRDPVFAIDKSVHTPLTIKTIGGHYISIHEAALYDYGGMTIRKYGDTLRSEIVPLPDGNAAHVEVPFSTPWRTVIVAHRAIDLTVSRIMLNLNEPTEFDDTSWIKPVKYLGIWWAMHIKELTWRLGDKHGATTENTKEYIDYCVKLGISALLVEGWNEGWDGDWVDGGTLFNFTRAYPDFDIKEVTNYSREKGVEIIGHHETAGDIENYERQMPGAYHFYYENGIKYVKLGYVGGLLNHEFYHHCQMGVVHYQKVVELAAKYKIMLDIHEPIKSTGIERTWPNLMTREGARGQEYEGGGLTPEHATMLPFTRCLAGGFDYTPGLFDVTNDAKRAASTIARQLALYVTIYSPLHMAADRPRFYDGNPAFKFIRDVPVDWQRTVPLLGEIGKFYVVARQDRNSDDWYVGGVTNEDSRMVDLYLDFLDDDEEYVLELYCDGRSAHYVENQLEIEIESRRVKKGEKIDIYLAPGGGFAVRLFKVKKEE
jgi:Glycoside hydrolase 97.